MFTLRHLALMAFLFGICLASKPLPAAPVVTTAPLTCNLPAPANLQVVVMSTNSISVDWDDVPGAAGYRTVAANAVTGQVYYDAISGTSFDVVTGLPPATTIDISVGAICPNGEIGDISATQVTTRLVVVDDILPGGGNRYNVRPNARIECRAPIIHPFCLAVVDEDNPEDFSFFKIEITNSNRSLEVQHINKDPEDGITYGIGWYLGSESWVPFYGTKAENAQLVYVYKLTQQSTSLGAPVMAFEVDNTSVLTICYPDQFWVGNRIVDNNPRYRVWMGCTGEKVSPSNPLQASPKPLQTSPNPFQDVLNIVLDDANASEVALMDASGRIVRSQSAVEGTQTLSFETSDLAPGLYLLRCQGPNGVKTTKVIKSR